MAKRKICIVLAGNVSSGKSSLAKALVQRLPTKGLRCVHVDEPYAEWANIFSEKPTGILERIYEGPHPGNKHFVYQSAFTMSYADHHLASNQFLAGNDVVIYERSIFSQALFFGKTFLVHNLLDRPSQDILLKQLDFTCKHCRSIPYLNSDSNHSQTMFLITGASGQQCFDWKQQRSNAKMTVDPLISLELLQMFDNVAEHKNGVSTVVSAGQWFTANVQKYYPEAKPICQILKPDILTDDRALKELLASVQKLANQ